MKQAERPLFSREAVAQHYIVGSGIEVGALHNPMHVPLIATVRYVDRMTKEQLYAQYPELEAHTLVDIDVIDNGEKLLTFADGSVDFVIGNHFIEHCEDPIDTLQSFSRVLKEGGVAYIAVPDMLQTFDLTRSPTPLRHLLEDHRRGPSHSRFEHFVEWARYVEPTFGRSYDTPDLLLARAQELDAMNYSIHYHCWKSAGFVEFVTYGANLCGLEIDFYAKMGQEFVTVLRKLPKT